MIEGREFAQLVVAMRSAQRTYFRGRSSGDLERSKDLERQVDRAAKEILEPTALPLFAEEPTRCSN